MTLENVLAATGTNNIKINYVESLYLASLDTLLDVLSNTPDSVQRLLLVGHNPGLEELVSYLSNQPIPMTDKGKLLTTTNLAIIEIAEKYNSLQQNVNKLRSLIRPKELSSKSW